MSSAVNKSSKRFVPKIGGRGSSIRAPVRRNTRRSFSVPSNVETRAASQSQAAAAEPENDSVRPGEQPKSRVELLGITEEDLAKGSGSAIEDAAEDNPKPLEEGLATLDRVSRSGSLASDSTGGTSTVVEPLSAPSTASAPVPTQSTQGTLVDRKGPEAAQEVTQSTLVDREVPEAVQEVTQSTQVEHAPSKRALESVAEERVVSQGEFSRLDPLPSQDASDATQSSMAPPQILAPRPPPPVQPAGRPPVRLNTLNAPRRQPTAVQRPMARPASSTNTPRNTVASITRAAKPPAPAPRPEAPPGCQIIEPEDLRDLKREERRRREAWESAQVKLMRELFVEKEHLRLMEEESYDETSSVRVAQATSETLTFNALKQAVMSELKEYKEKMEKEKAKEIEQQAKQPNGLKNGSGASAATSTAVATANSILEEGSAPPLKQLINVEKFKMSDLCKDIPVGTPNEKYDDYENARVQRRRDRLLLLRAKNWKRNLLKREPSESEKAILETVYAKFKNERLARGDKIKEESERKLKSLDDSARAGPGPAPTLEIGQDGQIRIEHTQVDRHVHNRSNQSESAQNKVEVDETQKTINSYSFSTKERPERWSKEETQKFYEALSAWGTDFNLIAHLFPTRSRHQIKTKFKYEERRHSIKVQMYLVHRRKANVNSYAEVSDQQIEDVKDIEEALERVRDEHEERMKIEQSAREQARSEDQEKQGLQSPKRRPAREANAPVPKRERLR